MACRTELLNIQPWRFQPQDFCWVRGWSQDYPVKITEQLHGCGVPHYAVEDHLGGKWRISQLELAGSPILKREGRR